MSNIIDNDKNSTPLLDFIETKNGHFYTGVHDFISTKHIYFIPVPNEKPLDFLLLAALWRMEHSNTRFSVYCLTHYSTITPPQAILIHKADILKTNVNLLPTKKTKQRNFTIKNIKQD